jgi:hypothetical protein
VTAAEFAASILQSHREYAGGRAGEVVLDIQPGDRAAPAAWLDRVRALLAAREVILHGRVVVLGLARVDEPLRVQLEQSGMLTALEGEVREPLGQVFRDASPSGPPTERLRSAATADVPATRDLLGITPLVSALRALLDDESTALPLALAVTGRWGAGKSSVMRQLESQLRDPPEGVEAHRRWTVVRFDAWKYERSERLWSALAKSVYEQALEARAGQMDRLQFRVRLERRRLGLLRFALRYAWPAMVAAAAIVALAASDLSEAGKQAGGLAIVAAVLGGAAQYWRTITDPFKRALERHASHPNYEEHLGFTSEADRDIACLTAAIVEEESDALAVFIDDLDRCSSAHLVEVLEAVNQIFNSDERARASRSVFVLGLDRETVASSIEAAYGDTVDRLKDVDSPMARDFGFHFIDKLVQLSVAVPRPRPNKLPRLLAYDPSVAEADHPEAAETLERVRHSSSVDKAEVVALDHLERNPRQAKRFHNVFRLQVYVAAGEGVEFSGEELVTLARWIAMRLRWPALADDLDQEPGLLPLLDAFANEERPKQVLEWSVEEQRLRTKYGRWFDDGAVTGVLASSLAGSVHRVPSLRFDEFLAIA